MSKRERGTREKKKILRVRTMRVREETGSNQPTNQPTNIQGSISRRHVIVQKAVILVLSLRPNSSLLPFVFNFTHT